MARVLARCRDHREDHGARDHGPPRRARARRGRAPLRIGAVQERWHPDPDEHAQARSGGDRARRRRGRAARLPAGADAQPLLRRRPRRAAAAAGVEPEELPGGPTYRFAARGRARDRRPRPRLALRARGISRRADAGGLGFNTAIVVAPDGELLGAHPQAPHPVTAGYYEDRYFRPGPADWRPVPAGRARRGAARPADLLGPVVPGARPRLQPGRRRRARLPDRDRLRARPSRLRHRSRSGSR